jgi:squalene-hopene/tetraprenyl-beta-curcumene cyclase
VPLWFGNEHVADETNPTYGTARVVAALAEVAAAGTWTGGGAAAHPAGLEAMASRGVEWLLSAQQEEGPWGGDADAPPSVEETALATEALARWARTAEAADASRRGAAYLAQATRGGTAFEPAPIGFYFARLWYFERLYPIIFTVGALAQVRTLGV